MAHESSTAARAKEIDRPLVNHGHGLRKVSSLLHTRGVHRNEFRKGWGGARGNNNGMADTHLPPTASPPSRKFEIVIWLRCARARRRYASERRWVRERVRRRMLIVGNSSGRETGERAPKLPGKNVGISKFFFIGVEMWCRIVGSGCCCRRAGRLRRNVYWFFRMGIQWEEICNRGIAAVVE